MAFFNYFAYMLVTLERQLSSLATISLFVCCTIPSSFFPLFPTISLFLIFLCILFYTWILNTVESIAQSAVFLLLLTCSAVNDMLFMSSKNSAYPSLMELLMLVYHFSNSFFHKSSLTSSNCPVLLYSSTTSGRSSFLTEKEMR